MSEQELWERTEQLATLIPDLDAERAARPGDIARLALDLEGTTKGLLTLRTAFPDANVSLIAARLPSLLSLPLATLQARARDAAEVLGLAGGGAAAEQEFRRLLETAPLVLDVAALRAAVADIRRLLPDVAPAAMLAFDPSLLLAAQDLRLQVADERSLITADPASLAAEGYSKTYSD